MRTAEQTLGLLTWNVQRASSSRTLAQVRWLLERTEADVVVLTEVCDAPGGLALASALQDHGWTDVLHGLARGAAGVLLASRVGRLRPVTSDVRYLPERFVAARLDTARGTIGLAGIYVPSRGSAQRRNVDKRGFQHAVTAALPALCSRLAPHPIVVAGDLNVIEPGHRPHRAVFGEWEYQFYAGFGVHGFVDAFRELSPSAEEHSWFGRGGNGYRLDHMFVSRAHRQLVRSCRYVQSPRIAGLSDHAAMELQLSMPSGRSGQPMPVP